MAPAEVGGEKQQERVKFQGRRLQIAPGALRPRNDRLQEMRWVVDVKKLGGFLVIFNHLKILLLFCNFCVAFLIDLCYTKLR